MRFRPFTFFLFVITYQTHRYKVYKCIYRYLLYIRFTSKRIVSYFIIPSPDLIIKLGSNKSIKLPTFG